MGSDRRGYERQMAELAKTQSKIAQEYWQMYKPNMQYMLDVVRGQLKSGLGEPPEMVKNAYQKMQTMTRQDFARQGIQAQQMTEQQWKQQGLSDMISAPAKAYIQSQQRASLEEAEANAIMQLRVNEAMQGFQTTLSLLDLLRGGSGQAGQFAMAGMNEQMDILKYLHQMGSGNRMGNALAGALAGAATGAEGGWVTALLGALAGGVGGYYR